MWAIDQNRRLADFISCHSVVELAVVERYWCFVHVTVRQLYRSGVAVRVYIATNCVLLIWVEFW